MKGVAVLALGFSLLFAGCYTLLKHPRVQNEDSAVFADSHDAQGVLPSDDCMRCHDAARSYYNETLPYGTYYRGRSRSWLYYYDTPWWSDPYYYGGAQMQADSSLPRPRDFGRRGQDAAMQPAQGGAGATHASPAARAKTSGGSNATASDGNSKKPAKRSARRATSASEQKKKARRVRKRN